MLITIFTATYNRKRTLPRLYQSLCEQYNFNFEWIVVDDDSTDGTEELICEWQCTNNFFPIKYYKQLGGGKHRAVNLAAQYADGELFFSVDSDDYLIEAATQWIEERWEKRNHDILGLCFRRIDPRTNKTIGKLFSHKALPYSTPMKINFFWNIRCDKAEIFKTSRVKATPFPRFEGERFCTEAYWIYKMADEGCGDLLCDNRGIRYTEYLEDGLTKNAKAVMKQNPKGYIAYYEMMLSKPIFYLHPKHVAYAFYILMKLKQLRKNEKDK